MPITGRNDAGRACRRGNHHPRAVLRAGAARAAGELCDVMSRSVQQHQLNRSSGHRDAAIAQVMGHVRRNDQDGHEQVQPNSQQVSSPQPRACRMEYTSVL